MKRILFSFTLLVFFSINVSAQQECHPPTSETPIAFQTAIEKAKVIIKKQLGFETKCVQVSWDQPRVLKEHHADESNYLEAERSRVKTQNKVGVITTGGQIGEQVVIEQMGRLCRYCVYGGIIIGEEIRRRTNDYAIDIIINNEQRIQAYLKSQEFRVSALYFKVVFLVPGQGLKTYFVEYLGMSELVPNGQVFIFNEGKKSWDPAPVNYDEGMILGAVQSAINAYTADKAK